jgi:glycosyltransferase involved in cell wall biosynthesis
MTVSAMPDVRDAKPLRIVHVLHTLRRAGAEMLAYELAAANRERLVTGVIVLDEQGPLAVDFQALGAPVWHTRRREGRDRSQAPRIAAIFGEFKPDVIHAHQYTPFFYASLARRKARCGRLLLTEHGRHCPDVVGWKRRLLNRLYLAGKADKVTAVCQWTKRALVANEGFRADAIEVVYNGVDVDRFADHPPKAEARRRWDVPAGAAVIVQVGNLRSVKDHPTALRAFAKVTQARPDALLFLAGDGPDREKLLAMAGQLQIVERTRFLGPVREIPSLLAAADVMLMTSLSEAHSVSLLEGMAARLPIVATNVGGIPETVADGVSGLLAPAGCPEEIAACLVRLLNDADMRSAMGQAGHERVRAKFLRSDMHRRYLEIYRQLAGQAADR